MPTIIHFAGQRGRVQIKGTCLPEKLEAIYQEIKSPPERSAHLFLGSPHIRNFFDLDSESQLSGPVKGTASKETN